MKTLIINKYDTDFDVDVHYYHTIDEDIITLTVSFDGQTHDFDYPKENYLELFEDGYKESEIAETIFDDNIEDLKHDITYFFEPSAPIDEMSDYDFYRSKF